MIPATVSAEKTPIKAPGNQKLDDITATTVNALKEKTQPAAPALATNSQGLTPESQQGTDIAQKALDAYIASPQRQEAMQREQDWVNARQTGQAVSDTPPKDETLERLQAAAKKEQAENQERKDLAADRAVYDEDMREISGMTDAERQQLKDYVSVRDLGRTENLITDLIYIPIKKRKAAGSLWDKYGEARLNELAETYARDLHQQERQEVQQAAQNASSGVGGAVLTTLGSIAAKPIGSVAALEGRLDELGQRTGRYSTLDPYSPGDTVNNFFDDAKQNVQKQIEGDGANIFRKGAAVLYQAGTGAVENVLGAITLGPGVTAAVNATGQLTRTISEASQRGATPGQAYLLAASSAALDYAMDKIPLDTLFGLAKEGSTSALKAALKQAGIEASTEGASFIGSQLLDMAILQQNSEYAQNVQNYREQGMNQQDAVHQANKDLVSQAGQQLLVAGLSGGVSAGVSTAIGNARNRRAQALLDAETDAAPDAAPAEPTPEQLTARQEPLATDTTHDTTTDQLLQNPQQLPQEQPTEQVQPRNVQSEPAQAETPLDTVSRTVEESVTKRKQAGAADDIVDVSSFKGPKEWKNFLDKRRKERKKAKKHGGNDDNYLIDNPLSREEKREIYIKGALNTARETRMLELFDTINDGDFDAYMERANTAFSQDAFQRAQDAAVELRHLMSISDADYDAELSGNPHPVQSAEPALQPIATSPLLPRQADEPDFSPAQDAAPDTTHQSVIEPPFGDIPAEDNAVQAEIPQPPAQPPIDTVSNLVEEATTQRRAQQEAALQAVQDQAAAMSGGQDAAETASPSIGAADQNFTGTARYQNLLSDDNVKPDRASDIRADEVPEMDGSQRVSDVAKDLMGSKNTTEAGADQVKQLIDSGVFSYDPKSNKQSVQEAFDDLNARGAAAIRHEIDTNLKNGVIADGDVTKAVVLANQYIQTGDEASAAEMMSDLSLLAQKSGRNLGKRIFNSYLNPAKTTEVKTDATTAEISRLAKTEYGTGVVPEVAPKTITYTDNQGVTHKDVRLTAKQWEDYATTRGQTSKQILDKLVQSSDYAKLGDAGKAAAIDLVYKYADKTGAIKAMSDHDGYPDSWMQEAADSKNPGAYIVQKVNNQQMKTAMDNLTKAWAHKTDRPAAKQALEAAYDTYSKSSADVKKAVMDAAEGAVKQYMEARADGFDSNVSLSIIKQVQSIPQKNRQKAAYQYQAVANTKGLSEAQLDKAMKLYMPDYDPSVKKPVKTEVKYDYIRRELGFFAKEYAKAAYAMQDMSYDEDDSGTITKDEAVQAIVDLGFDEATATKFYRIYQGSSNSAKAALNKFIEENY